VTPFQATRYISGEATYDSVVLADHPVAYWPMQETSGTSVADLTGNGHTGTTHGTMSLGVGGPVPGVTSFLFGNFSGYITTAGTGPSAPPWSVEAFVNCPTNSSGYQTLLITDPGSGHIGYVGLQNNFTNNATYSDNVTAFANNGPALGATWNQIVWTLDGSGNLTVYLNGQPYTSYTGVGLFTSAAQMVIGAALPSGGTEFWNNYACRLSVYGYVLSSSQVLTHYNAR